MKLPKNKLAQTVIQFCERKDIKHIVISPGSRNAPLTLGFTNHTYFKTYSIVDERCAAFFALGIAQKLQKPVALVCTSGSALLNYYPAIAEAYYSDIPLVVLSADRPEHMINIGDGQTINQANVYKNHILYSANLKGNLEFIKQDEILINEALNTAKAQRGPVHINVPLDEPLYELVNDFLVSVTDTPVITPTIVDEDFTLYRDIWSSSKRKLVLVGVNSVSAIEQGFLNYLATDDSVIVLTETTSNLHHDSFFSSIDQLIGPLSSNEFKKLQPELLLTFGGLVVSKKVKAFLRQYQPKHHWHIDVKKANDTFFCLNKHFKMPVNTCFEQLLHLKSTVSSDYRPYWESVKSTRKIKHEQYLKTIPFSDFKVFDIILMSLQEATNLQLGNSSTVRYAQLFNINKTIKVYCNRGTSGIDGSTSTAIGSAIISQEQTVLITGDLSFFYDSNALWNNYIPKNFRIILINNSGGGIFRILPGDKNTDNFDTYFETKHSLTAKHLCNMYDFEYQSVSNASQLKKKLNNFYENGSQPKLLEVFTPSTINDKVLLNYFSCI